jgi:hypothetical protein
VCSRCHQGLFKSWETTFHAPAAANPAFLEEMVKAEEVIVSLKEITFGKNI